MGRQLGNEEIPPEQQRLIRRMLNLPGTDGDGKPSMVRAWHFTQTLVAAFLAIIIQVISCALLFLRIVDKSSGF